MKNAPTKVCSSSVLNDKMIIHDSDITINTNSEKEFKRCFKDGYRTEEIIAFLRDTYTDFIWHIHGYIKRHVIINSLHFTIWLLRVKAISKENPEIHRTHVVLPSFLLPYMQNCARDVIHICIKKGRLSDELVSRLESDTPLCHPNLQEIENYLPPVSSSFAGYIAEKFRNVVICSLSGLFRCFARLNEDDRSGTDPLSRLIFLYL